MVDTAGHKPTTQSHHWTRGWWTLLPISICGDSTPRQSATPAELQKPHIAGRRPVMGHRRAEIITPLAAGILGAFWLHPSASAACCERVKGVI
jgi:hypothetical protein